MTDNEIIKALECCIYHHGKCTSCPLYAEVTTVCKEKKDNYVLDLINRQKAEIKRLQSDNVKLHTIIPKMLLEAKYEAVKEFAERLKEYSFLDNLALDGKETVYVDDIDNLVKEMTKEPE